LADVKRKQLDLPGAADLNAIQLETGRQTLENVLAALEAAAAGRPAPGDFPVEFSSSLLDWITTLHRGASLDARTLAGVRSRLSSLPTKLTDEDFLLLDQLLRLIEAHASHLYHRLPVAGGRN
jgi:hypothetical protein